MKSLKISLPITQPTGKVRIKERIGNYQYGNPIAIAESNANAKVLNKNLYLEWQIGYDTKHIDQSKNSFSFKRKGEDKYLYELSEYLLEALQKDIIDKNLFYSLKNFVILQKNFIDNEFSIERKLNSKKKFAGLDFSLFSEQYPLLLYLENKDFTIEIKVDRKQRAVGVQAMIYVCLPIINFENKKDFLGRKAKKNEKLTIEITKTKNNFLISALKIFSIASEQHNLDIRNIINIIEENHYPT